jgi:transketolase
VVGTSQQELDQLGVNTLRGLAVDQVEAARSGHPGMPLGAAPMAYVLWTGFLRHDPADPAWPDRDRFVLSAGHGSALLYGLLHLCGYGLTLEELRRFRQWGSRTPGHPEYRLVPGAELTTGPLGQGFATGVGMAVAERFLAARFNRPGHDLVDHRVWGIVSDGDLMEGVSSEAASLAGHQGLGKLVYLYDDNHISIEGHTDLAFSEDVERRFTAYGWQVLRVGDGNDLEAIARALEAARDEESRPSLIMVRTRLGYASPKEDDPEAHGAPLGAEGVRRTKERLGLPPEREFYVPPEVYERFREVKARGGRQAAAWRERLALYEREFPDATAEWRRRMKRELPVGWEERLPHFAPGEALATRAASGKVLNALAKAVPELVGGSADLAPSNDTFLQGEGELSSREPAGRNIHFGVREHAMAAFLNGLALHGGFIPYGGTFLVFSDYLKPALRLAALMELPVRYVFTHDSIGLGEDGPTHQPVEHLAMLRAVPGLTVIRPADAAETVQAWRVALEHPGPVALVLSRQKLPVLPRREQPAEDLARGAYVLAEPAGGKPQVILMATGSEVALVLAAAELLEHDGVAARVVSMPSWELFAAQPPSYRERVLPAAVDRRLAVEAGASLGWHRWVGTAGDVLGLDRFGASAPGEELFRHFGFTPENVARRARALVEGKGGMAP